MLHLNDTIQPISDEYLVRGLKRATDIHAEAILIELNTPGGLLETTREMVRQILDSSVPVIVYVAPSGSRAGSAGFFLLEAADIAAMAPGTNAGASHPVIEGGGQIDPVMKQKMENDTTAFLRSFVARRNRNTSAAEDAVLNSKSYTEQEALKLNLITLVAANDRDLLDAIDGKTITRFNGSSTTLHTKGAELIVVDPVLREKLLDKLTDPNLAVLFLIVGGLLIYLEFNAPGTIVPGALGTLLVLISLFSLNLLPVRYTAVMLIVGALVLLVLEAKFASHGVLAGAGTVCLVFGLADAGRWTDSRASRASRNRHRRWRSLRTHHACLSCAWPSAPGATSPSWESMHSSASPQSRSSRSRLRARCSSTASSGKPNPPPRRARREGPGARRAQSDPVGRPDSHDCSGAN